MDVEEYVAILGVGEVQLLQDDGQWRYNFCLEGLLDPIPP